MWEFFMVVFGTLAAAAAVTALLGTGFSQLVKREKHLPDKPVARSHDDVSTGHPTAV